MEKNLRARYDQSPENQEKILNNVSFFNFYFPI